MPEKVSKIKIFWNIHPKIKKGVGFFLILIGFISLITPFTPFGLVFFIGLQMIGVRLIFIEKLRKFFRENKK